MGERVKVKFLKNYIAPVGQGIAGQKDAYKVFPKTKQLDELIADGTVELVGEAAAATRETATIEPPEKKAEKPAAKKGVKDSA